MTAPSHLKLLHPGTRQGQGKDYTEEEKCAKVETDLEKFQNLRT